MRKSQKGKARLFRQHKVPVIGPLTDLLSYSAIWIGMMNFLMIAVTLYSTTLRERILSYLPWMNLGYFLTFLFIIVIGIVICVYKFIVPSYYEFRSSQYKRHGNMNTSGNENLRETLESIDRRLAALEKGTSQIDEEIGEE